MVYAEKAWHSQYNEFPCRKDREGKILLCHATSLPRLHLSAHYKHLSHCSYSAFIYLNMLQIVSLQHIVFPLSHSFIFNFMWIHSSSNILEICQQKVNRLSLGAAFVFSEQKLKLVKLVKRLKC